MDKAFVPEDRKKEARDLPQPTQPLSNYGEELQIIMDMGSSEYHALTSICISDDTIRGFISVLEFYKDANTPASNINNTSKVSSGSDAMNQYPAVHHE